MILLLALCIYSNQARTMEPSTPKDEEVSSCCSCYEEIPEHDNCFSYDPDHLVCIHCYFYRISRTDDGPALKYVCKNGASLHQ